MYGYIDGIDFVNLEAEKYWSFPKAYKGDKKKETKYMITCGDYIGSLKQDGHYARFIKDEDGNMILQGRTKSVSGEYLNKIDWVPQCHSFFDSLPNGTCLLGELYFPNQKGSRKVTTILGCLKNKALDIWCSVIYRHFLTALHIRGFSIRVTEIKAVYYKWSHHMVHFYILKHNIVNHRVLATSASGLDAKASVRMREQAVLYHKVYHTACHLASNRNSSMTVFHKALTDMNIFGWCFMLFPHINLSGFYCDTIIPQ